MENKRFTYEGFEMGGPRHLYRQELILRLLEESHIKGRVLDAGCGDGCISLKLAKSGWEVYALDSSLDFLRLLEGKLATMGNLAREVEICHRDLNHLDFPVSFFDAIVCGEVLEHMEDDYKVISSFNRILRLDGICVVTVPAISKGWDRWDNITGHRRLYSIEDFKKIIRNSSFLLEKYIYWGFPLMKLYHRFVYLNWVKRMEKAKDKEENIFTKIGKSKLISLIGSKAFCFDEIFGHREWGIGLAIRLKKISN